MFDINEPFLYRLGAIVPRDVVRVVVHHSIKVIPYRVFRGRRQLKEVLLPEGLEEIGEYAFSRCELLECINYPSSLTNIGKHSFNGCISLKEVVLPQGLQEIGLGAFRDCVSLARIDFPSTLFKIGDRAFLRCILLKAVMLPEGLRGIGDEAFRDCESLEQINCVSTLIRIGMGAFESCTSLVNMILMRGIMIIEANVFGNCRSLGWLTTTSKAFLMEVTTRDFTCRLVIINGIVTLSNAEQVIISPERLNYISSPDILEVKNTIMTIMNINERSREENIERVQALITSYAFVEVSTILELVLWKNKMDMMRDLNPGTRGECRVMCGADNIIPGVMSFL